MTFKSANRDDWPDLANRGATVLYCTVLYVLNDKSLLYVVRTGTLLY